MPGMYGTHGWVIMALYNTVILIVTCLVCMVHMGGSSWPFIIRLFVLCHAWYVWYTWVGHHGLYNKVILIVT